MEASQYESYYCAKQFSIKPDKNSQKLTPWIGAKTGEHWPKVAAVLSRIVYSL